MDTPDIAEPLKQRLEDLQDLQIMDSSQEPAFDEITRDVARILGVPICFLSFIDAKRQWIKSAHGTDLREIPIEKTFCKNLLANDQPWMVVEDASKHPNFSSSEFVVHSPGVRFYACAAILSSRGQVVGTLCIADTQARSLSPKDLEILRSFARHAWRMSEKRKSDTLLAGLRQQNEKEKAFKDAIIQRSTNGVALFDTSGRCLDANASMCRILGANADQMIGTHIQEDMVWARIAQRSKIVESLLKAEDFQFSGSVGMPDARVIHYQGSVSRFQHGDQDLVIVVLSDSTELETSRRRARSMKAKILENLMEGVLLTSPKESKIIFANAAAVRLLGYESMQQLLGPSEHVFDVRDPRYAEMLRTRDDLGAVSGLLRMKTRGGDMIEAEISSTTFEDLDGELLSSTIFRDATEENRIKRQLAEQNALLKNLADKVPGMLYQYLITPDGQSCFPFSSDGIERIYGVTSEQVVESSQIVRDRVLEEDWERVYSSIERSKETLTKWECEYRVHLPDHGVRWLHGQAQPQRMPDGGVLWHGYIQDITERKETEKQTRYLAYFDSLTGLPNRTLLIDRLKMALLQSRRSKKFGAILFVDLDKFKQINDTRGHSLGDQVLVQCARQIANAVRASDTVGRLGGDEFVVLLPEIHRDESSAASASISVAEKILRLLSEPFELEGSMYSITGSIGIAMFPHQAEDADDVMRKADIAMYRAKASGRNKVAMFEQSMQQEVQRTLSIENGLKKALARDEFHIVIQSQVDPKGGIAGGECLLRWSNESMGVVSPAQFIPIAEENGLIVDIGAWVLEQACRLLVQARSHQFEHSISVNVSVKQLQSEDFIPMVRDVFRRTGAPPGKMIFELTEGLFIGDVRKVRSKLEELVQMGVRISIDDFGTGYSSLRYLQRFPIGELKIDRSFVTDLPNNQADASIVRTIASMSEQLSLSLVAEGVETSAQKDWLAQVGCDAMQGFYFARPTPIEDWLKLLMGQR